MASSLICPGDAELLRLATEDSVPADLAMHVAGCAHCKPRLERAKADLEILRGIQHDPNLSPPGNRPPPTVSEPTTEQAVAQGPIPGGDGSGTDDFNRFGENAHSSASTHLGDDESPDSTTPPTPTSIGKYLVIGKLGSGGQADVYRVASPWLNQERVLKLARNPIGLDRRSEILREGKIIAELNHPNMVQVYDLEFLDDRPFLVMEYVRGRNLEQFAREHPVAPRQAASLVARLCAAVEFAHRRGITHRDIKPSNVLIDEGKQPRLIDFGMARLCHFWFEGPSLPGGTFQFMAPEQARFHDLAEQKKVGPRSDVFALGGILYFLLTGKVPFPGEDWRASQYRAARCAFDPALLDAPRIPKALKRICLKAMAADPEDRFGSADALARALKAYVRRPALIGALGLSIVVPLIAWAGWTHWLGRFESKAVLGPLQLASPSLLSGELTVRVWTPGEKGKHGWSVEDPRTLPVLCGERVRVETRLNQKAFVYLLWLDSQGEVASLYPWHDRHFGMRPEKEAERETVVSPLAVDEGWPIQGPGGLETALLLARRTPLPATTDLAALIGRLPPSPLHDPQELAVLGVDSGQPILMAQQGVHRGIAEVATKIDEPILRLLERLKPHFEMIRLARFAYQGE
jgi:serine/threonine protein kinase